MLAMLVIYERKLQSHLNEASDHSFRSQVPRLIQPCSARPDSQIDSWTDPTKIGVDYFTQILLFYG